MWKIERHHGENEVLQFEDAVAQEEDDCEPFLWFLSVRSIFEILKLIRTI